MKKTKECINKRIKKIKEWLKKIKEWLKKIKAKQKILILYATIVGALSYYMLNLYNKEIEEMPLAPKPYHCIVFSIMLILSVPFFIWLNHSIESMDNFYSEYEDYFLNKTTNNKNNGKTSIEKSNKDEDENKNEDAIRNMLKNNREIIEYFKITKWQEKVSYWISIACAVVGVGILVYSVYAIFKNGSTKPAIISVISGAITEVVSGIVLWIHNKSAIQLNYYYNALHENEKFLSAINLADKLGKTEREQMYMEIIKAQIRSDKTEKEENENKE